MEKGQRQRVDLGLSFPSQGQWPGWLGLSRSIVEKNHAVYIEVKSHCDLWVLAVWLVQARGQISLNLRSHVQVIVAVLGRVTPWIWGVSDGISLSSVDSNSDLRVYVPFVLIRSVLSTQKPFLCYHRIPAFPLLPNQEPYSRAAHREMNFPQQDTSNMVQAEGEQEKKRVLMIFCVTNM